MKVSYYVLMSVVNNISLRNHHFTLTNKHYCRCSLTEIGIGKSGIEKCHDIFNQIPWHFPTLLSGKRNICYILKMIEIIFAMNYSSN